MRKILFLMAVSAFALNAKDVRALEAQGNASAEILAPVSISHNNSVLDFGKLIKPTDASYTVSVDVSGDRSASDDTKLIASETSADSFTVIGSDSVPFTLNVPTEISLTNGENDTMTVSDIKVKMGNGETVDAGTNIAGVFSDEGFDVLVGGTLNVPANAPVGEYNGTYTVTLNY